jgi:hypothetical protein
MGIIVKWENEDRTALRWEFDENWTWRDVEIANHASARMRGTVEHPVDSILDVQACLVVPDRFMSSADRLNQINRPNDGVVVAVGAHGFVRVVLEVLANTDLPLRFAATDAEAYDILHRHRKCNGKGSGAAAHIAQPERLQRPQFDGQRLDGSSEDGLHDHVGGLVSTAKRAVTKRLPRLRR